MKKAEYPSEAPGMELHEAESSITTCNKLIPPAQASKVPTARVHTFEEVLEDLSWSTKQGAFAHLAIDTFGPKNDVQGSDILWPPCCVSSNLFNETSADFFKDFKEWMRSFAQPLDDLEWRKRDDPNKRKSAACAFQEALKSAKVQAEHEAYLERLDLGGELVLRPVIPGTNCFNPVLENFWKPWAKSVLFSGSLRRDIVNAPGSLAIVYLEQAVREQLCWSVPTLPILRCMIKFAPGGRILDVGAGSGYWSALLARLGADVVAIDDFSWFEKEGHNDGKLSKGNKSGDRVSISRPLYYDIVRADAVEYVKAGKAEGRALFFSWPKDVMHCLEYYQGDTVFWIGEASTDEMPAWPGWVEVHRMEIPQWIGLHDDFVVYKRK